MSVYKTGDTVRFIGAFYTFAGVLTDLAAAPSVKVYNADKTTQVGTTVTATKASTGTYYADITLPITEEIYYIEFSGTSEGTAIVQRMMVPVKFT
jgi:hypothetical protein